MDKKPGIQEIWLPSTNGKDQLHVVIWKPQSEIKAILQISHGMVEYVKRYAEFAEFLAAQGILVIGNDHLGHGETAKEEDLGYFGAQKSKMIVDDLYVVTVYAREAYGVEIPFFLFGHSMGSFLARRYLMTYGKELKGAVISGTGFQPAVILAGGRLVSGVLERCFGERHRSELLRKMAFGAYNKKIPNARTENDWLTKERDVIDRYNADHFCTFRFTVNGYQTLFDVISYIQKKENIEKIPKTLPIFMISGREDPVGDYGKGVEAVRDQLAKTGIRNIRLLLYPDDRHELTNETDRQAVYQDVLRWIRQQM